MFRVAVGQLCDQGLRSRPAERQRAAIDDLEPASTAQNDGTNGKTGESAIAVHTKNSVTRRVAETGPSAHRHGSTGRAQANGAHPQAPRLRRRSSERQGVERDQEDVDVVYPMPNKPVA